MNHEVQNDDVLFDRLVDGELSPDERRRLLASLDDRADGWRRCALAFLEAETWRGAMGQIVREPEPCTKLLASPSIPRKAKQTAAMTWLATAAALLVAFALGWQTKRPAAPAAEDLVVEPSASLPVAIDAPRLPDADAITLVVQGHAGARQRVQVPLVEGRHLGQQFADSPQWADPAVRQRFAEQGLDLQARRRYVPLYFEQQDQVVPMIVPIDDATVTPVSRPVY